MDYAPTTRRNTSKQLPIRLLPLPFDERAVFVEHVCGILNESRFGLGRLDQLIIRFASEGEPDHTVFLDATPQGPVPSYTMWEVVPALTAEAVAEILQKRAERSGNGASPVNSPTTLARGSPAQLSLH